MKILLTGGSGFIASHFCEALARAGHAPVIADLSPPSGQAQSYPYYRVNVADEAELGQALAGCDAVLHLAAAHHDFGVEDATFFAVNQGGAEALCRAMDRHGIRNLCFTSSVAVYGTAPRPHSESVDPQPITPYGQSKLAAEQVFCRWVERGEGRRCLVIRPTATIGPRHFANMYTLIRQIDAGRFLMVGSGENRKSLAVVENLVAATLHLWLGQPERCQPFDVFNYVDKPDLTSAEIAATISQALGRRPRRLRLPLRLALAVARPFDVVRQVTGRDLPISAARIQKLAVDETVFEADKVRASGFAPQMTLPEALRRMVAWYLDEGRAAPVRMPLPAAKVIDQPRRG